MIFGFIIVWNDLHLVIPTLVISLMMNKWILEIFWNYHILHSTNEKINIIFWFCNDKFHWFGALRSLQNISEYFAGTANKYSVIFCKLWEYLHLWCHRCKISSDILFGENNIQNIDGFEEKYPLIFLSWPKILGYFASRPYGSLGKISQYFWPWQKYQRIFCRKCINISNILSFDDSTRFLIGF